MYHFLWCVDFEIPDISSFCSLLYPHYPSPPLVCLPIHSCFCTERGQPPMGINKLNQVEVGLGSSPCVMVIISILFFFILYTNPSTSFLFFSSFPPLPFIPPPNLFLRGWGIPWGVNKVCHTKLRQDQAHYQKFTFLIPRNRIEAFMYKCGLWKITICLKCKHF